MAVQEKHCGSRREELSSALGKLQDNEDVLDRLRSRKRAKYYTDGSEKKTATREQGNIIRKKQETKSLQPWNARSIQESGTQRVATTTPTLRTTANSHTDTNPRTDSTHEHKHEPPYRETHPRRPQPILHRLPQRGGEG